MAYRKSAAGPYVSMNLTTAAFIDDEITDPIMEEEAAAAEKELAKKLQRQSLKKKAAIKPAETTAEDGSESGSHVESSSASATAAGASTDPSSQLLPSPSSPRRESTDSEGNGPETTTGFQSSGHVISSPYELSHYPIEIMENKNALQRQISNRMTEVGSAGGKHGGGGAPPRSVSSLAGLTALGHGGHHHSTTMPKQQAPPSSAMSCGMAVGTKSAAAAPTITFNQGRRWSLQPHHHAAGQLNSSQQQQSRLESIREQQQGSSSASASDSAAGDASPVALLDKQQLSRAAGTSTSPLCRPSPASPSALAAFALVQQQQKQLLQQQEKLDEIERELCSPQHVEMHTFRDAIDVNYQRMGLTGEELSGVPLMDLRCAARSLVEALQLRSEYMELVGGVFPSTTRNFLTGKYPRELPKCRRKNADFSTNMSYNPPEPPKDHWGLDEPLPVYEHKYELRRHHGTMAVLDPASKDGAEIVAQLQKFYVPKEKYLKDLNWINRLCNEGPLKTFCYRRLTFLQTHFQLHVLLNEQLESAEQKSVPHRDFYNIRKVDTHIHAASSMNQKHLLRFIKKKMRTDGDEVVHVKDGRKVTMREMFAELQISPYDLSVDMLDVHADRNTFHRFDKFNAKYNPIGQNELREIFIKTDNYVGGRYFAEVLKEVLNDLEDSKYQQMEPRLSIYGRAKDEWDRLAKWAIENDVWSQNVRWMIQIPRLYDVYRCKNMMTNFDTFLDNVFAPLFEVTNDPSTHPELHHFLQHVSGLDSVDDESKHEHVPFTKDCPEPADYTLDENPAYSYYLYYMYANLTALNAFRRMRGLNTFALRPHCGEAGHVNHLSVAYLTSESIAHGLLLRKVPVLHYLFYLSQIGIAMSPLSNNHLFLTYHRNPMPDFLMKGMNVSLSTDDPLQFHFTKEALMEEYSIAAQVWKLSSCDMCELARNSVLQSGFEDRVKYYWLGPNYHEEGVLGNDVSRTNVPDIRVSFRHESLVNELCNMFKALSF